MKRNQNLTKLASLFIAAPALGLSVANGCYAGSLQIEEAAKLAPATPVTPAETKTPSATDDTTGPATASAPEAVKPAKPQLALAQQKKLATELFGFTKTAKSSKHLTAMIAKCDSATNAGLNEEYFAYVRSLKAWALNRRGNNRCETAKQLKAIDNVTQYDIVFEQAINDFNESISIDTSRYRTFNSRGIAFVLNEQYLKAAQDFTKAVGLKADFTQGYFNRAEVLSAMGRYKLAVKDYTSVLRLTPDDTQAITGRAHANVALKKYEVALIEFNAVVEAYPNNVVAWVNRGDCHAAAGDWKLSLADYASAKKLADANQLTGGSSTKLSDLADQRTAWVLATASDESIRDADKAIALIKPCVDRCSSPTVAMLETLAAAQAATGDFTEAKQSQSQVIKLAGAEVSDTENQAEDSPHQIRLALYEEAKAYVQAEESKSSVAPEK